MFNVLNDETKRYANADPIIAQISTEYASPQMLHDYALYLNSIEQDHPWSRFMYQCADYGTLSLRLDKDALTKWQNKWQNTERETADVMRSFIDGLTADVHAAQDADEDADEDSAEYAGSVGD